MLRKSQRAMVLSADEDNLIQCWKVSNTIVGKDMDDVSEHELEA